MVFSSLLFLFAFLPLVLGIHFAFRSVTARNGVLLGASLVFYAWGEGPFIALLLASIGVNHALGRRIARDAGSGRVSPWLAAAVAANLLLLFAFKYADFLIPHLGPVHLPLGISFFTFQAITYVVDVHRGTAPAQSSLFRTALYISLFPQLVAGPIVRYGSIAAQLASRAVTREGFALGVRRFSIGLGKKVLVADGLAVPADAIFAIPGDELTAGVAWLGVACYGLQIYFDFSGYSDMAIGLGHLFGFRLPENFEHPYVSRSIREFWRRWHITLSTWFRDYLYVPLGGSRGSRVRTAANLLLVFALCGLWHGAAWQFLVWGLYHGLFLAAERTVFRRALERSGRVVQHLYVVGVVFTGWVFFRAESLGQAAEMLGAMVGLGSGSGVTYHPALYLNAHVWLLLGLGALGATPWLRALGERAQDAALLEVSRVAACVAIWIASAATLAAGTHDPFIYFRF